MKQTAVEKLETSLLGIISFDSEELRVKYKEAIKKIKEIERQDIEKAFMYGQYSVFIKNGEQYYNETYTQSSE